MEKQLQNIDDSTPTDVLNNELSSILDELFAIKDKITELSETRLQNLLKYYDTNTPTAGALNLAYYLSLRQHDLRPLQQRLSQAGLSSLGRSEADVLLSLDRIMEILSRATNRECTNTQAKIPFTHIDTPHDLTNLSTQIFGPKPQHRQTYIMVTLPSDAAWNYSLVESLIVKGMNCARINCAHDDADHWQAMVKNINEAKSKLNASCKIFMDLAGQKIRTGPINCGPAIKHIKVNRNVYGRLVAPTDIILEEENQKHPLNGFKYRLSLPRALHTQLAIGDRLRLTDVRGKKREIVVVGQRSPIQWLAQCTQSIYISPETDLIWQRRNKKDKFQTLGEFRPSHFHGAAEEIRLYEGDPLFLTTSSLPGSPALFDDKGIIIAPARVGCSPRQAVLNLKPGEHVWLDDGKLGCIVESASEDGALLVVTQSRPKGVRIRANKGINFPDSDLNLAPITEKDLEDLDFICQHADMIGFSFVQSLADINSLLHELEQRNAVNIPVIAKIETNQAVKNLPEIILGTIGRHPLGIMIARGDLAVELGGERLAEIQEEILWLCEAAHIPVIWATQVLETMAKDGALSRPEFTDAAMAERAECVMLNKGPYIERALRSLDNIIKRMEAHQYKKRSFMRALHW